MLKQIRTTLLQEAKQSPNLLSDLAGLESYIAESYDARSFIELLQNADDAQARRFIIYKNKNYLIVANDGREFTDAEFESLCRSAASNKDRHSSIGYRGIGFKSIVSFADKVHLVSGNLKTTFCRKRTSKDIPHAQRVPLVRIPHALTSSELKPFCKQLREIQNQGFTTAFVFGDITANAIEVEFASFDPTSLLFLRNIQQVQILADKEDLTTIQRQHLKNGNEELSLRSSNGLTQWYIMNNNGISLAFYQGDGGIESLTEHDAVVHAFLPTNEPTGLGVKLNGDVSTDPSRTKVVLDQRTTEMINSTAEMVLQLIHDALSNKSILPAVRILPAILPTTDPRMAKLGKPSFKRQLLSKLEELCGKSLSYYRMKPQWFGNAADFESLSNKADLECIPRDIEQIDGVTAFLRAVGVKEAAFDEICSSLSSIQLSESGAADIVARIVTLDTTGQLGNGGMDRKWRLWPIKGKLENLSTAKISNLSVDQGFRDQLIEKIGSLSNIKRIITNSLDNETAEQLFPEETTSGPNKSLYLQQNQATSKIEPINPDTSKSTDISDRPVTLKKWRNAENQIMDILNQSGWDVKDVSLQNLGYDLEGVTPEGKRALIEVKSVARIGESFTMTNNEESVARHEGLAYYLAITTTSNNRLLLTLIQNPLQQLRMTRRCRQWEWFCENYPSKTTDYELS